MLTDLLKVNRYVPQDQSPRVEVAEGERAKDKGQELWRQRGNGAPRYGLPSPPRCHLRGALVRFRGATRGDPAAARPRIVDAWKSAEGRACVCAVGCMPVAARCASGKRSGWLRSDERGVCGRRGRRRGAFCDEATPERPRECGSRDNAGRCGHVRHKLRLGENSGRGDAVLSSSCDALHPRVSGSSPAAQRP